jgi:hypothetical protein
VVEELNQLAVQWNQEVANRGIDRLNAIVLKLERQFISPWEFLFSDAVGKKIRTSAVEGLDDGSLAKRIDLVRKHWRKLIDHKDAFSRLLDQFVELPMDYGVDNIIIMVTILIKHGFFNLQQLNGAGGIRWGTLPDGVEYLMNALGSYIRVKTKRDAERNPIMQALNALLESGGVQEKRIVRPELGPRAAVAAASVQEWSSDEKRRRLENIVLDVTIDSLVDKRSYISAVRGFLLFVRGLEPEAMPIPPRIEWLLLWSTFFKSHATYGNYLSALKWVCEGCEVNTGVFGDPALRRAKNALKLTTRVREKMWIQAPLLVRLVSLAHGEGNMAAIILYVLAYVFMMRVPSELIPLRNGGVGLTGVAETTFLSTIQRNDSEVRIVLKRRKNAQKGDIVRRDCSCHLVKQLCPVHVVVPMLMAYGSGCRIFEGFTPAAATRMLRKHLVALKVVGAMTYTLHSFRRGAAQDVMEAGCSMKFLLAAGGWSSRACFIYIKSRDLCDRSAMEYLVDNSDSDEDGASTTKRPTARK